MAIKSTQKEKLRKLLEKISTPEEMKAFDMEILSKNQEKTSEKIVEAIEKNKTEINLSFIENLIDKTKESLTEKIDEIRKEFSNKKYPTYDDSELQKKIDLILNESKGDKFIQEASQKSQNQVIEELITIGDLLVSIRDISNQPKEENSESFIMINKSLEGIGGILQKILSFTGSNDSTRLKDSTGAVLNPATSDNQTNGTQKSSLVDSSGVDATDLIAHASVTIDHLHNEVHEGHFFSFSSAFSISAGQSMYFLGIPDGKNIHFNKFALDSDGNPITVTFFENPTVTSNGTPQTGKNRNRTSSENQTISIYSNPTISEDGTQLDIGKIFAGNVNPQGSMEMPIEWILKSGNKYSFKITNGGTGTTNFVAKFFWYEV